jgi:ankyrin repeat protein
MAQYLAEHGADVNGKSESGGTPLHYACSRTNIALIRYLIAKGANVNATDHQAQTPLHLSAFQTDSLDKRMEITQYLLAQHANVNAMTLRGETPLMITSRTFLKTDLVKLLVERGAAINAQCKTCEEKYTVVIIACRYGRTDVVKYLLAQGADTNARDQHNATALIGTYQPEIVDLLLSRQADVNAHDDHGMTPFLFACERNLIILAKKLIAAGADKGAINTRGQNALLLSGGNDIPFTSWLLNDLGFDINATDANGTTILMNVCRYPASYESVKFLIDRGAKPSIKTPSGESALSIAKESYEQATTERQARGVSQTDEEKQQHQKIIALLSQQ